MNDSAEWQERVRKMRASGTPWWWWYMYQNSIFMYIYYKSYWDLSPNQFIWVHIYLPIYHGLFILVCLRLFISVYLRVILFLSLNIYLCPQVYSYLGSKWGRILSLFYLSLSLYIYIYIFKKKTKDRLIHDYKLISIPYFQFLVWTKNMKKKLIQDFFRPNG